MGPPRLEGQTVPSSRISLCTDVFRVCSQTGEKCLKAAACQRGQTTVRRAARCFTSCSRGHRQSGTPPEKTPIKLFGFAPVQRLRALTTNLCDREQQSSEPTQRVRDEVEEGVAQQPPRGEAEQNLQQVLVLVTVGLNWDQEQDEERSRADQQGGPDGLEEERGGY